WAGREFNYLQCFSCNSLFCWPMPNQELLSQMYGLQVGEDCQSAEKELCCGDANRVLTCLAKLEPGTFVDYGCGSARLLQEVKRLGWKAVGVEWDEGVANGISRRTGIQVVGHHAAREVLGSAVADVLHVGDVIEHLTLVNTQMPGILGL